MVLLLLCNLSLNSLSSTTADVSLCNSATESGFRFVSMDSAWLPVYFQVLL